MLKTLRTSIQNERTGFAVPRTAQKTIPIKRIYKDGIWDMGKGRYTKTWQFSDINYENATLEDQTDMFSMYCALLNTLPLGTGTKITVINHRPDQGEFERSMLVAPKGDQLDHYRDEYNGMLIGKAEAGNRIVQDKYITITAHSRNIEDARAFFNRVRGTISASFHRLDSRLSELDNTARLRLLHDFYRMDEAGDFSCDLTDLMAHGQDFRDKICPDSIEFKSDHFIMGDGKFGRVLFMSDRPTLMSDDEISKITDLPHDLVLSIDLLPIPSDEAVKDMQRRILSVESDITRWQQRQNQSYNFSATVPYDLDQFRAETKGFLDKLTMQDEHMILALVTVLHIADSKKQLDSDTEELRGKGFCKFSVLKYQQEDALNTALPYGIRPIETLRTLTTQSAAIMLPFRSQEVRDVGGIYYGMNATSGNLIVCNRKKLLNGNSFALGVSGSGKSFKIKEEIAAVALNTDDDIIIVDPEREYAPLVQALGGETVTLSASSPHHINPLAFGKGYGIGENPLAMKSEFLMSICEQQIGVGQVGAYEKSIIDRCTSNVYEEFLKNGRIGVPPTLADWRLDVARQKEPEAQKLALAAELFTVGTLGTFAQQTNVNMENRIMHYDLYDMGDQLKPIGLNVMLESIQNRVAENYVRGHYTWVFIDEVYLYFKWPYSAQYLFKCWKRFRKYYALITGITQNIEECLRSETARLMLANSEFLILLNQAATDQQELAKLLKISERQLGYVTNAPAGQGLIRVGGAIVPFYDEFPKNTDLYRCMTTKPGER